MKRITIILALVLACASAAMAQKFALVDMDYILKNVPQYEMANEQLNQLSQRWQKEVEAVGKEAENMYQAYLAEKVFLTEEQVKKREATWWQKRKRPLSSATNTSVRKANSTRSASRCSSRCRTKCTMPLRKWPTNAAIRPYSTVPPQAT